MNWLRFIGIAILAVMSGDPVIFILVFLLVLRLISIVMILTAVFDSDATYNGLISWLIAVDVILRDMTVPLCCLLVVFIFMAI